MGDNKKLIITGTTGFIGRPLCEYLSQKGWSITALNRRVMSGPWADCQTFELADPQVPEELFANARAVIHIAGIAHTTGHSAAEYVHGLYW